MVIKILISVNTCSTSTPMNNSEGTDCNTSVFNETHVATDLKSMSLTFMNLYSQRSSCNIYPYLDIVHIGVVNQVDLYNLRSNKQIVDILRYLV